MSGFFLGAALFGLLFLVHVAWWRLARPTKTAHLLLRGWLLGLLAGIPAGPLLLALGGFPYDLAAHLQGLLMAAALGAAYIATYPALEVTSPTLAILNDITAAGPAGLERKALEAKMDDSFLLHPRIADLLSEGLVVRQGERFVPTDKGRKLAGAFARLRAALRLSTGG